MENKIEDIKSIEKEIEKVIDEKDFYRKEMIKIYNEDKVIEKASSIKGSKTSAIVKNIYEKFKLIDNPAEIYKKASYFKDYKNSYFEAIIIIRNKMMDSKNNNLFYSYLFMVSHYTELVIKAVLLKKNEEIPTNHDILNIFTEEKDFLTKIGLKSDYYEYCVEQLKQIKEYASNDDFSMCFRFPLDKKYKSKIITNKMMNIKFDDIEKIVNKQKRFFIILELMIVLSEKDFYRKVYEFALELLNEVNTCLD